jgi:alpha-mannosidase
MNTKKRRGEGPILLHLESPILRSPSIARPLAGPLFKPLAVEDTADSWGTGRGSYRTVVGRFKPSCRPFVIEQGPIRTITRSVLSYRRSRVVIDLVSYPSWPVLEFRFRVTWNEDRGRLKLSIPTALSAPTLLAEVPGGAIHRPDDGEEHVHGRWLVVQGRSAGKAAAIGIASSGQPGLDFKDGEIRLSVLRSSAYCHERGFDLDAAMGMKSGTRTKGTCPQPCPPSWKFADIGVHEFRLLLTAGAAASVRAAMPGLADHLAAPPAAYAHLPFDAKQTSSTETLLAVRPSSIRLLACKHSWDGSALVVRLQEAVGETTKAEIEISWPAGRLGGRSPETQTSGSGEERGHVPPGHVPLSFPLAFARFEIKTLRIEKDGTWRAVRMIEEE